MKNSQFSNVIKKSLQAGVLLAVLLFNFGPFNTGVAHAVNCYTLTLVANPVAGGTISADPAPNCGGQYTEGTVVTLTGLPEPGYLFGTWQGAVTGVVNPTNVAMSADKTVTAVFMADQWQKAIDVNAPYSITVNTTAASLEDVNEPNPINCEGINIRGGKATVWFKYTAPASALVSLDTVGSFQSAINPQTGLADAYDTYISVWTGTIDTNPGDGNPVLVACNDDNELGYVSQLGFNAVAGTTYYIQVAQYRGLAGTTSDPYYNGGTLNFHVGFGTQTQVFIGDMVNPKGTYTLLPGQSTRPTYALDSGPVKVISNNTVKLIAAIRDAWLVNGGVRSFAQLMGLPQEELSDRYWFPAYNNVTLSGQLRLCNVDSIATTVTVKIGGVVRGTYPLNSNNCTRPTYALDSGPVEVFSSNGAKIIAAIRDAWLVNGQATSFVQLMGLPNSSLSSRYWFPAYNNVTLSGQLRIGNVDTVPTTVTVKIGGVVRGTYPLNPNESVRPTYALDSGPVEVYSSGGEKIIAAIRDAWLVNGQATSFAQMMGLPQEKLSDRYLLPAYNNVSLSGQLRIGNVDSIATTVTVKIGGVVRGTYNLNPNESIRPTYALDSGPVEVYSSNGAKIIVAIRDAWLVNGTVTSFVQTMALPKEALSTTYWFPAYNNVTLSGQLRFGVP